MATFTIDSDNNITAFATPEEAQDLLALGAHAFTSEKELAKLSADWPASRLIEVWNGFAGVAPFDGLMPVKKFTDRKTAVSRIWKAIQRLSSDTAPQGAPDASKAKGSSKKATAKRDAPKAKKSAKRQPAATAREGSKKAEVLGLLRRKQGATLPEIMKLTAWQAHTVRGFISTAGKKNAMHIQSSKNDRGERVYQTAD